MLSYLLPKGSHSGTMAIPSALDEAVATLPVDFTASAMLMYTHGFGYPGMCKKLGGVYAKLNCPHNSLWMLAFRQP